MVLLVYTYREGPVGGLTPKLYNAFGILPQWLAGKTSLLCSLRLSRALLTALPFGHGRGRRHLTIVELQTDVDPRLSSGSEGQNTDAPSIQADLFYSLTSGCVTTCRARYLAYKQAPCPRPINHRHQCLPCAMSYAAHKPIDTPDMSRAFPANR